MDDGSLKVEVTKVRLPAWHVIAFAMLRRFPACSVLNTCAQLGQAMDSPPWRSFECPLLTGAAHPPRTGRWRAPPVCTARR